MSDVLGLNDEPQPLLWFKDIPHGRDKEYKCILYNIFNQEIIKVSGHGEYVFFLCSLLKGNSFDNLYINMNYKCKISFSRKCFKCAWQNAPDYKNSESTTNKVDVMLTFKKPNRQKMIITEREYIGIVPKDMF